MAEGFDRRDHRAQLVEVLVDVRHPGGQLVSGVGEGNRRQSLRLGLVAPLDRLAGLSEQLSPLVVHSPR
jgi:hypothetical protein